MNSKVLFLSDIKKPVLQEKISKDAGSRARKDSLFSRIPPLFHCLGTLVVIFSLTMLLSPDYQLPVTNIHLGDVSPSNIKAKKDFLIEDINSTQKNRDLARESTLPVYDFDLKPVDVNSSKVKAAFNHIGEYYSTQIPGFYTELKEITSVLSAPEEEYGKEEKNEKRIRKTTLNEKAAKLRNTFSFEDKEKEFSGMLGAELDPKTTKTLRWHHYNPDIATAISGLMSTVHASGVAGNLKLLKGHSKNGITLREIETGKEENIENIEKVLDMEGLQAYLKKTVSDFTDPRHTSLQKAVVKIVSLLTQPNLTFNKQETESRREKAEQAVKPVFFNIKKGEMVVREGERIGEAHLRKLIGMNKENAIRDYVLSLLGLFIFFTLLFSLAWGYLIKYRPEIVSNGISLLLLGTILIVNFLIFRLLAHFALPISSYLNISEESICYALPFAAAPMLTALLFEIDIGILMVIVNFALVGTHLEWKMGYSLVALIGGLFSVLRKDYYKQRSSILKNGIFIGLLNMAAIMPLNLLEQTLLNRTTLFDLQAGFVGGILVTLVVSWLLPAFESVFRVHSDLKLQEISNLNHPLLRKMIVEAPGTYHHSIVVSTLAEGAAEAVGANSLLVRVGAYYHDIGKMKKPQYFIENQKKGKNKHDKLAPSMSALIVSSHVKDGVELARKNKLNPLIINFIKEHHGTTLMKYFYQRAKERENPEVHLIEESYYRYAGPKVQSKETAILLLADSVEAAARSLPEPNVSRLQGLVEKIITEKLMEGELEDCHLTLKDLNNIGRVFVRILTGIFHCRVEYPDKEGEAANGHRSAPSGDKREYRPKEIKDTGPGNIKKFKMPG